MAENLKMHNPLSPGEIIREIYLKPYDISEQELAAKLKVSPDAISRLLKAEIELSAEMALRISVVLGRSPGSWMDMQQNYALWQAEQSFESNGLERIDFNSLRRIEEEGVEPDKLKNDLPAEVA